MRAQSWPSLSRGTCRFFCLAVALVLFTGGLYLFTGNDDNPSSRFVNERSSHESAGSGNYLYQNVVISPLMNGNDASHEREHASVIAAAMDSQNPVTRDFAVSIIPHAHGGAFNAAQVCDLWENVYSRWTYVEDPAGGDYLSPASRTITLGLKGDCDDFAVVVAAIIGSVGGDTRIVYARNGTAGHAYPEVFIGTTREESEAAAAYIRERYGVADVGIHGTRDGAVTRYWLNLDWWSSHPGGQFFADDGERTVYYPDGRWERVGS